MIRIIIKNDVDETLNIKYLSHDYLLQKADGNNLEMFAMRL